MRMMAKLHSLAAAAELLVLFRLFLNACLLSVKSCHKFDITYTCVHGEFDFLWKFLTFGTQQKYYSLRYNFNKFEQIYQSDTES